MHSRVLTHRAGARLARPEHERANPCVNQRAGAHRARLDRDVQRGAGAADSCRPARPRRATRRFRRAPSGRGCRSAGCAFPENFAVSHHHRTDRHLADLRGARRPLERTLASNCRVRRSTPRSLHVEAAHDTERCRCGKLAPARVSHHVLPGRPRRHDEDVAVLSADRGQPRGHHGRHGGHASRAVSGDAARHLRTGAPRRRPRLRLDLVHRTPPAHRRLRALEQPGAARPVHRRCRRSASASASSASCCRRKTRCASPKTSRCSTT